MITWSFFFPFKVDSSLAFMVPVGNPMWLRFPIAITFAIDSLPNERQLFLFLATFFDRTTNIESLSARIHERYYTI